jgi:hypothetical protein
VLAGHVLFEIEAIDRMYLNLYQPRLQHGAGIAAFFVGHRGYRFASSGLMAPMTAAFTADIDHFVAARGLDLVRFARGQRKDDVTAGYLRQAERDDRGLVPAQVLYVGVAQEKQKVFRTVKRRNPVTGAAYPWLVPSTAMVNQYYFYCVDEDFGPYADRLVMPRRPVLSWSEGGSPVPARHESALACARQRVSRKARRLSGAAYRPGGVPSGASLERACSLSAMSACR